MFEMVAGSQSLYPASSLASLLFSCFFSCRDLSNSSLPSYEYRTSMGIYTGSFNLDISQSRYIQI